MGLRLRALSQALSWLAGTVALMCSLVCVSLWSSALGDVRYVGDRSPVPPGSRVTAVRQAYGDAADLMTV